MTVTALAIIGILIAIGIIAFGRGAAKIGRQRVALWSDLDAAGVKRGLDLLLKRGYDGAFAVFRHRETGRFIQFLKYVTPEGKVGLEMHFPRADWSAPFYPKVLDALRQRGVEFERLAIDRRVVPDPDTTEFAYVDFGSDIDLATTVAEDIVADALELGEVRLAMTAEDLCWFDPDVEVITYPSPFRRKRK